MNGARLMNSSRITLTLGAAGGGLLAAAFLQTAVAFADTTGLVSPSPTDVFNFEPTGSQTVTSSTDDLPFYETSTGTQDFDVIDSSITGDPTVGSFDATVTDTDILGVTNVEEVVTSDLTGTTGDPTVGSVYDTLTFDDSGYSIVLTDIPSTTAGQALWISTLGLDTPFGDYTLPSPVFVDVLPSPVDVVGPATGLETDVSTTDLPLGLGDISTGTQEFDVINTSITGDPTVGTFDATVTDTDILGVTNVEDVGTSDLTGTTGDPTVGSVYDTLTFDDSGYSIVLTDIPSTTAGGTFWESTLGLDTPFGDYTLPSPVVVDVLPSPVDVVGAASGDGLTAGGGATADTVGTAAIDGLTGLLGLF
jgi:hypothetical protein